MAVATAATPAVVSTTNGGSKGGITFFLVVLLGLFSLVSLAVNVWHSTIVTTNKGLVERDENWKVTQHNHQEPSNNNNNKDHVLAGLSCETHGGPSPEIAQEMVYWQDIPSDNTYVSPFKKRQKQYMTFEPDKGGWNNIRMAMETVLAMAYAMGRTLVLPPDQRYYLLDKGIGKKHKTHFSFAHFFHMESIAKEHREGLEIISMKQFLQDVAMTGQLISTKTRKVSFPPHNRTDWDGENKGVMERELHAWLRQVTHSTIWDPETCMASFASTPNQEGIDRLHQYFYTNKLSARGFGSYEEYIGKPTPVNATPAERMRENWAGRKRLCVYDLEMQNAPVVHFPMDHGIKGARLLTHFYAMIFHEDWRVDLWMKRFVRDHVRYIDEIQCAAARVVHAIRQRVKRKNKNTNGDFDAFHVRRGDFQYRDTRLSAQEIHQASQEELQKGATVYIATDEKDKSFFEPLAKHYDLVYLDDFKDLIPNVNVNYYGMLDQLVASRSRVFFGCWFSTFTSYINRMRGYHADLKKLEGYEQGAVESYYYARAEDKYKMKEFYPVKRTYHSREYPASWRNIDTAIGFNNE